MSRTSWKASTTTGDVNCDGVSSLYDIELLIKFSLGLDLTEIDCCGDLYRTK